MQKERLAKQGEIPVRDKGGYNYHRLMCLNGLDNEQSKNTIFPGCYALYTKTRPF